MLSVGQHTGRGAPAATAGNWGQKARLEFQGKSSWIEPVTVGQPDTFISVGCCPRGPNGRSQELRQFGHNNAIVLDEFLKDQSDDLLSADSLLLL